MRYNHNNHIFMLCPSCGRSVECYVHVSMSVIAEPSMSMDFSDFNDNSFSGIIRCAYCACEMFNVDAGILDTVRAYNLAGFETEYSCEGHVVNSKLDDHVIAHRPYIIFSYWQAERTGALIQAYHETCAMMAYGINMRTDMGKKGNYAHCTVDPRDLEVAKRLEDVRVTFEGTAKSWPKDEASFAETYIIAERQRFNDGMMSILRKAKELLEYDLEP